MHVQPSCLSYEWFIPIKWMKRGVEQEQLWLLQKSGISHALHYNHNTFFEAPTCTSLRFTAE